MAKRSYFCVLRESLHMIPVVSLGYTGVHPRWCKIYRPNACRNHCRLPPGYEQFLWSKMKLVIKMCIEKISLIVINLLSQALV